MGVCKSLLQGEGINRFPALISVLDYIRRRKEVKARGIKVPKLNRLRQWIKQETRLGLPALRKLVKKTGNRDAIELVDGTINSVPAVAAVFNFEFMGGSMGSVVGEKITRAIEHGLETKKGVIIFSSSGGARMQEGIFSLMQMAKSSAALARLKEAGIPYISVLTDPTYGGVTASFAMLGDVILAEPKSMIGFAGPRVIEQTIRQPLPEGFQRAEYLLEHGMVDMIEERKDLKETLSRLLVMLAPGDSNSSAAD